MVSLGISEKIVRGILDSAGVGVEGRAPGDIHVKNPAFYRRFLLDASIGLGESYMEEWWECEKMDLFIEKVLRAGVEKKIVGVLPQKVLAAQSFLTNMQSRARAKQVAEAHYDIGNDLYEVMLDKRMVYTCGYWKNAKNLEEAQDAKLDLLCRKAGLKPGMKVLDLGCGFGGFAMFAAEKYGCNVRGVTISKEQQRFGSERAKRLGLSAELVLDDYRNAQGQYDAVVSVGMMEHVGWKNHRNFYEVIHRCLKPEGIAVVHTIAANHDQFHGIPFFEKYVFPNAASPSLAQMAKAADDILVIEDVPNIGPDYRPTLLAWWDNFDANYHTLNQQKYDRKFYLMWRFYLLAAAGAVAARESQLFHMVMTRMGREQPDCRMV